MLGTPLGTFSSSSIDTCASNSIGCVGAKRDHQGCYFVRLFTTAATATVIFLAGRFAQPVTSEERHRLFGVLASLLIGATIGALVHFHAPLDAPLFPFVITLGVVAVATKAFKYGDNSRGFLGAVGRTEHESS